MVGCRASKTQAGDVTSRHDIQKPPLIQRRFEAEVVALGPARGKCSKAIQARIFIGRSEGQLGDILTELGIPGLSLRIPRQDLFVILVSPQHHEHHLGGSALCPQSNPLIPERTRCQLDCDGALQDVSPPTVVFFPSVCKKLHGSCRCPQDETDAAVRFTAQGQAPTHSAGNSLIMPGLARLLCSLCRVHHAVEQWQRSSGNLHIREGFRNGLVYMQPSLRNGDVHLSFRLREAADAMQPTLVD
mmetsp:Transcript_34204/g.74767  ORF Transcript_34204/g.74767 Transcript_34204/m.74767 type:complete len:244 (-) Transcript_34204:180-911(-)